ncbi:FkbM family methyltransferase [Lichenicoccus sp.]|uniref:FkbM family methyltransferase n=1 Tax=Lichenicoccus sp. TaxID=2781899 RepID=UPI003D0B15B0
MAPSQDLQTRPEPWQGTFSNSTTLDDIVACFRLLLGRLPNREEWRGHSARVGEPLDMVVGSYVSSLEFSRRGLGAPGTLGSVGQAQLPSFSIYFEADDAAVGRHVTWEDFDADVIAVFRRFVRPGAHVLDLGANIGYFTMLSASLVGPSGSVMAIEPNPGNARLIEASRRANGFAQVRVVQVAAGREAGLLVLHRSHSNGTTSAAPDDVVSLLAAETVACVRVDGIVPRGRRIGFIKADVEGAEYLALSGCLRIIRRDRPVILTEFSPSLMQGISGISGPGYLAWLTGLGYRLSIVQPDGSLLAAGPAAIMAEHAARGIDHLDLVAEPIPVAMHVQQRLRRLAAKLGRR